jgi:hypothetical protein
MNFTTNNRLTLAPAIALLSLTLFLIGASQTLPAAPAPTAPLAFPGSERFASGMPGDDAACKPVFAATDRLLSVPNHAYMTKNSGAPGGKVTNSEMIFANGTRFVMVQDKWTKVRETVQEARQREEDNKKNAKSYTCRYVGEEAVNGEAALVYTASTETEDGNSNAKLWISKSRGLLLKQEMNLDSEGKDHWSIRYEYSNVSAPKI